jgi:hypothetical protein
MPFELNLLGRIAHDSPLGRCSILSGVRSLGDAKSSPLAPCDPLSALQLANARGDARAEDVFYQFDKTRGPADLWANVTLPYVRSQDSRQDGLASLFSHPIWGRRAKKLNALHTIPEEG